MINLYRIGFLFAVCDKQKCSAEELRTKRLAGGEHEAAPIESNYRFLIFLVWLGSV